VIASDDDAASILVGVPGGVGRVERYTKIQEIVASLGEVPEEIHVIGAPVAEALLGTHILEDLGVPEFVLGHRIGREGKMPWRVPKSLYELRLLIGQRIGLVPVAIAIMMVVFWIGFRGMAAAVLPMMEVGACLIVVFGLMGWFGVPVYLTIAVLPVILTAIGVADEIHIFSRYVDELREHPEQEHLDSLRIAMAEMWRPVVKTSLTTAVGFLSFALSPLGPVKVFGVFTAVGIIFCMLWSLAVIPAQLAMLNPRRLARRRGVETEARPTLLARFFARCGVMVVRWRFVVLLVAVVVAVLAPLGVRQMLVQDSWIDGFAPDSEFHQATRKFNECFLGTHMLLVCVDTGHELISGELEPKAVGTHKFQFPGDLVEDPAALIGRRVHFKRVGSPTAKAKPRKKKYHPRRRTWESRKSYIKNATREGDHIVIETPRSHTLVKSIIRLKPGEKLGYEITPQRLMLPEVVRQIDKLEAFLEDHPEEAVGGVIGPADYIATTRFMKLRKESKRSIPDQTNELELLWNDYRRIRGEDRLRQIIDTKYARCLISVFMKNANYVDTQRLMDDIRAYEREHLRPEGITLAFAGDVAVSQTLIRAIVSTQVRSLLVSLVGILVVTTILSRSLIFGVLAVLPCALAVLINFAVMGLVGMPLGVATSMFAGMTLGIGVDYAIHLLERYRLARSRGQAREASLTDAVTHTGPAVLIDAVAVALGFGIMMLSQVPANARLGGLVVLSIVGCLAATLLLLPALLSLGLRRGVSEENLADDSMGQDVGS
ncbi:MAG: MMPL family transporter, partial [Phycisphaerae bacterium]|nr:MMPL family transporter [Phycisphaerae bacterium]